MERLAWLVVIGACGAALSAPAAGAPVAAKSLAQPTLTTTGPAWQGLYAGIYASDDLTALHLAVPGSASFDGIGGQSEFAGALLGFNHRFSERVVGGAEIDAALARGGSHFDVNDGSDFFASSITPEWGASAKGRIGYLISPDTLLYAVGGGVVAVASYGCEASVTDCPDRTQKTLYGWPLVGLGAETQIGRNWRFRYEYDIKFLPTLSFDPIEVTPLSGTANVALIYGFGQNDGTPATHPTFGYAPPTWTGLHGGIAGGHAMSVTSFDGSSGSFSGSFDGLGGGGLTVGVFGGYDQQIGNFVAGVEGGYYVNGGRLQSSVSGLGSVTATANSYYSLRGRAGVIVNPSTMIYALAGWIHADGTINLYNNGGTVIDGGAFSREGKEFGGGVETWVNRRLSIRAEYAYATFDNGLPDVPLDVLQVHSRVGTATLAAVLHFGQ